MVDLSPPFHDTLRRVINECIDAKKVDDPEFSTATIAERLGVKRRTLQHYMEGEGRHCPAAVLPALCEVISDYRVLDAIETAAGRVAFHIPVYATGDSANLRTIQGLVREVGEALDRLAATLEDGVVERQELQSTLPALDDVIRECVVLKHWLQQRQARDSVRPKPDRFLGRQRKGTP